MKIWFAICVFLFLHFRWSKQSREPSVQEYEQKSKKADCDFASLEFREILHHGLQETAFSRVIVLLAPDSCLLSCGASESLSWSTSLPATSGTRNLITSLVRKDREEDVLSQKTRRRRQTQQQGRRIPLQKALQLVESYGLKECVARTSCELSCNPDLYGRMGRSLSMMMNRLGKRVSFPGVAASAIDFYRTATSTGRGLRGKNCKEECKSKYPECKHRAATLLRLASTIDLSI